MDIYNDDTKILSMKGKISENFGGVDKSDKIKISSGSSLTISWDGKMCYQKRCDILCLDIIFPDGEKVSFSGNDEVTKKIISTKRYDYSNVDFDSWDTATNIWEGDSIHFVFNVLKADGSVEVIFKDVIIMYDFTTNDTITLEQSRLRDDGEVSYKFSINGNKVLAESGNWWSEFQDEDVILNTKEKQSEESVAEILGWDYLQNSMTVNVEQIKVLGIQTDVKITISSKNGFSDITSIVFTIVDMVTDDKREVDVSELLKRTGNDAYLLLTDVGISEEEVSKFYEIYIKFNGNIEIENSIDKNTIKVEVNAPTRPEIIIDRQDDKWNLKLVPSVYEKSYRYYFYDGDDLLVGSNCDEDICYNKRNIYCDEIPYIPEGTSSVGKIYRQTEESHIYTIRGPIGSWESKEENCCIYEPKQSDYSFFEEILGGLKCNAENNQKSSYFQFSLEPKSGILVENIVPYIDQITFYLTKEEEGTKVQKELKPTVHIYSDGSVTLSDFNSASSEYESGGVYGVISVKMRFGLYYYEVLINGGEQMTYKKVDELTEDVPYYIFKKQNQEDFTLSIRYTTENPYIYAVKIEVGSGDNQKVHRGDVDDMYFSVNIDGIKDGTRGFTVTAYCLENGVYYQLTRRYGPKEQDDDFDESDLIFVEDPIYVNGYQEDYEKDDNIKILKNLGFFAITNDFTNEYGLLEERQNLTTGKCYQLLKTSKSLETYTAKKTNYEYIKKYTYAPFQIKYQLVKKSDSEYFKIGDYYYRIFVSYSEAKKNEVYFVELKFQINGDEKIRFEKYVPDDTCEFFPTNQDGLLREEVQHTTTLENKALVYETTKVSTLEYTSGLANSCFYETHSGFTVYSGKRDNGISDYYIVTDELNSGYDVCIFHNYGTDGYIYRRLLTSFFKSEKRGLITRYILNMSIFKASTDDVNSIVAIVDTNNMVQKIVFDENNLAI